MERKSKREAGKKDKRGEKDRKGEAMLSEDKKKGKNGN